MSLVRVSAHAEQRARERLGSILPSATWQAIADGIAAKRFPWVDAGDGLRLYEVPVDADGHEYVLPVVVRPPPRLEFVTVYPLREPER